MANFWAHNEFMTVNGGKMSKSLGNAYTLTQLMEKGFSPMAFRYFVLLANYRTILNFTFDALTAAQNAYNNAVSLLAKHYTATEEPNTPTTKTTDLLKKAWEEFKAEITNDLGTPKAIAVIWRILKETPSRKIYDLIIKMDETLSLCLKHSVDNYLTEQKSQSQNESFPKAVIDLCEKRLKAKQSRDYATADQLRLEILALGYEIIDTKNGYSLRHIQ
jgi:cysteinyl-tRNA synthetase